MFLEKSPIISQHKKGSFVNNLDILRIASLIEYNIRYAMALMISQDTTLVPTVIATYNEIEDRCNILLDIYEEDILSSEETLYDLNNSVLQIFKTLNEDMIGVIKIISRMEEISDESVAVLQDINEYMSLLFKASIDAYVQQDIEIIKNSASYKERLLQSNVELQKSVLKASGKASVSNQIEKISTSIIEMQSTIIKHFG